MTPISLTPTSVSKAYRPLLRRAFILAALLTVVAGGVGCTTTTTKEATSAIPTNVQTPAPTDGGGDIEKALEGHIQLALSYIGQKNRDQARYHLQKATAIDSTSAGVHNGWGLLYQVEKEDALAEEHFRKALGYDREFTRARNNFGVFLYSRGRYQEAYEQFVLAGEDLTYDRRGQVFLSIGVSAEKLGKLEEAKQSWEKAINLEPTLAAPYLELADLYFERRDYPQARAYLERHQQLAKPSARSLWLGVRLENAFGNEDGEASRALALQKLFPYSREAIAYQKWLKSGRP